MLALTTAAAAATAMSTSVNAAESTEPFGYSFNTSTIRGQKLSVEDEAKLAAKAGYNGFEPWLGELQEHVKKGGSLKDLGKVIADWGMKVESSTGLARWIVDGERERKKGRRRQPTWRWSRHRQAYRGAACRHGWESPICTITDRYRKR